MTIVWYAMAGVDANEMVGEDADERAKQDWAQMSTVYNNFIYTYIYIYIYLICCVSVRTHECVATLHGDRAFARFPDHD